MTNAVENTSKREFIYGVWRKSIDLFFRDTLPKAKIGVQNLNIQQFFYSKRLLHPKRHLKSNYYMTFEENRLNGFFEAEIGLPNLDFHQFFCSKRLMHSENSVKRWLYIEFEGNLYSRFWDTHFQFTLRHFRPKPRNIMYAFIWYCV